MFLEEEREGTTLAKFFEIDLILPTEGEDGTNFLRDMEEEVWGTSTGNSEHFQLEKNKEVVVKLSTVLLFRYIMRT